MITAEHFVADIRASTGTIDLAEGKVRVLPASLMTAERCAIYKECRAATRLLLRLEAGSDYLWQLEQAGKAETGHYLAAFNKWANLEHDYRAAYRAEAIT